MKILELTSTDNERILVNFQNVTHVTKDKTGSIIYTVRDSGYYVISVIESLDKIIEQLKNK